MRFHEMPTSQGFAMPSVTARSARLEARISPVQKALFQQAANLSGRSLSELVVQSTQEAATRIVREYTTIRLTQEEQIAFASALLTAPPL